MATINIKELQDIENQIAPLEIVMQALKNGIYYKFDTSGDIVRFKVFLVYNHGWCLSWRKIHFVKANHLTNWSVVKGDLE